MHIRGARKQEVPMSEGCGLLSLKLLVWPVYVCWALPKWAGPAAVKRVNFGPQHDKNGLEMGLELGLQNSRKNGPLSPNKNKIK